jgi:hypothetical protein
VGRLIHVAVFTWKADTTPEQEQALADGLAALPGLIPDIRSYLFGPDGGLGSATGDFAVVAAFDDAEGYRRYAGHPAHVDLRDRLLQPIVDTRRAVQFVVSGS